MVTAPACIVLLLLVVQGQLGRLESLQTQHQFSQAPAGEVNAFTQVDGFDLALLTSFPVLIPPAPLAPLVEITRPHHPSRLEKLPRRVRPPPSTQNARDF